MTPGLRETLYLDPLRESSVSCACLEREKSHRDTFEATSVGLIVHDSRVLTCEKHSC